MHVSSRQHKDARFIESEIFFEYQTWNTECTYHKNKVFMTLSNSQGMENENLIFE